MKDLLIYDKDSGLGHYSQHAKDKGKAISILGFAKTYCKIDIKQEKIEEYEDQEICKDCDSIANGKKPILEIKPKHEKTKRSKKGKSKQNLFRLPGSL